MGMPHHQQARGLTQVSGLNNYFNLLRKEYSVEGGYILTPT
jgi:hypothetical protein